MFSVGDTPHGCGHAVRTVSQGLRVTAANFVTRDQKRENVTILTNTYVDKIILGKERDVWKAEGVETVSAEGLKSVFRAHKEIIISAGAYCSPAILLRSGIGAKSDVEKHGIVSYVNLPGVGRNLMDHPVS